mmetsp:Transcript_14349/g.42851  ORF Transcript_14349/g.42851 Transcript_14349/m.42851 type:complete len:672 (-) Transcript_14349:801-2816(-)
MRPQARQDERLAAAEGLLALDQLPAPAGHGADQISLGNAELWAARELPGGLINLFGLQLQDPTHLLHRLAGELAQQRQAHRDRGREGGAEVRRVAGDVAQTWALHELPAVLPQALLQRAVHAAEAGEGLAEAVVPGPLHDNAQVLLLVHPNRRLTGAEDAAGIRPVLAHARGQEHLPLRRREEHLRLLERLRLRLRHAPRPRRVAIRGAQRVVGPVERQERLHRDALHISALLLRDGRGEAEAPDVATQAEARRRHVLPGRAEGLEGNGLQPRRVLHLLCEASMVHADQRVEEACERRVALLVPSHRAHGLDHGVTLDVHSRLDDPGERNAVRRLHALVPVVERRILLQHLCHVAVVLRDVRQGLRAVVGVETLVLVLAEARDVGEVQGDEGSRVRDAGRDRLRLRRHGRRGRLGRLGLRLGLERQLPLDEPAATSNDHVDLLRLGGAQLLAVRQRPGVRRCLLGLQTEALADLPEVLLLAHQRDLQLDGGAKTRAYVEGVHRQVAKARIDRELVTHLLQRRLQGCLEEAEAREGRAEVVALVRGEQLQVLLLVDPGPHAAPLGGEDAAGVRPVVPEARQDGDDGVVLHEEGLAASQKRSLLLGHATGPRQVAGRLLHGVVLPSELAAQIQERADEGAFDLAALVQRDGRQEADRREVAAEANVDGDDKLS